MKVSLSNVQYTNYPQKNISFGDNAIKSPNKYRPNLHTHYTYLGRGHFDRTDVAKYAIDIIRKSNENVEFLFCGCSDGSEVFDMVMELKSQFDAKKIPMDKFPKIKAFDVSSKLIDTAKTGRINLSEDGINYANILYGDYKFFTDPKPIIKFENDNLRHLEEGSRLEIRNSYQFDKNLLEKIEFYKGEMLEEFKRISSKTRKIVFCRNVARYNSEDSQRKAAKLLANRLKPGSLVIVGVRDEHNAWTSDMQALGMERNNALPFVEEMRKTNFIHRYDMSIDGTVYQKVDLLPKNKFLRVIKKLFKRL